MPSLASYSIPFTVSLLLHAGVVALVMMNWESQSEPERVLKPKYIQAKLVQLKTASPEPKAAAPKKPKVNRIDLEAKRREQERLRQQKQEKQRVAQAKAKKAREEKQRRQEAERQRELAQKRRREEEARVRQFENELAAAIEKEEQRLEAETDEAVAQSYSQLIEQRIVQNWRRPPSARNGMTTILSIQMIPTGEVVNVSIVQGSGDSAFDRSAVHAVKRVERFEELDGMPIALFERYFRQLKFTFRPQDLRL